MTGLSHFEPPSFSYGEESVTEQFWLDSMEFYPELIREVKDFVNITILGPKDLTEKICQEAVSRDGLLLANIPSKYKTIELCMMALEQNPEAIKYFEF